MKAKKLLSAIIAGAMVLSTMSFTAFAAEGDETAAITEIGTVEELKAFRDAVNGGNKFEDKTVKLTDDIDLAGEEWEPIGGDTVKFAGEFDGNGKTISNLTNTQDVARKGLFGLVEKCYIHDLTLKDVTFSGTAEGMRVGALAGNLQYYNVIKNVVVDGLDYDLNDTDGLIGGLAGYVWTSYVKDCKVIDANMNIVSTNGSTVGTMIAYGRGVSDPISSFPYQDEISESDYLDGSLYNYVDSSVKDADISLSGTVQFGGFIGGDTYNSWRNTAKNCAVDGLNVTCADDDSVYSVGGFMGYQYGMSGGNYSAFENCSAKGTITGNGSNTASVFGGFVGWVGGRPSTIANASADVDIVTSAGNVGGFVGETQQYFEHALKFENCEASGDVKTENGVAGGFAGELLLGGDGSKLNVAITNSAANGSVDGTTASGLVGEIDDTKNGNHVGGTVTIIWCKPSDDVTGTTNNDFLGEVENTTTDITIEKIRTLTAVADKQEAKAGDEITITVTIDGEELVGAKWDLIFDSSKLEYTGEKNAEDNKISDEVSKTDGTYGKNETVATYTFNVKSELGIGGNVDFSIEGGQTCTETEAADNKYGGAKVINAVVSIADNYKIEFKTNGGNEISSEILTDGTVVDLSSYVPTRSGYSFEGWYSDEALTTKVTSVTLDKDITVYAKWSRNSSGGGGTLLTGSTALTNYTLSFDTDGGSKIDSVSKVRNTTVDLSKYITAKDSYSFDGWYTDKELTEKVTEIKMTENTTLYAKWVENKDESDKPNDGSIPNYAPDIFTKDHKAYIVGRDGGYIAPNESLTRAEAAAMFFRLIDDSVREEGFTKENSFTDVANSDWFNTAVSTLANLEVLKGRTADTFEPNATITRAEFMTIVARLSEAKYDGEDFFTDISGHWAREYINIAASIEWAKGDGKLFRPNDNVTRAEAMTIINRALNRMPENTSDLLDGMQTFVDNQNTNEWYYLNIQEATNSHDFEKKADGVHEKWTKLNVAPNWASIER